MQRLGKYLTSDCVVYPRNGNRSLYPVASNDRIAIKRDFLKASRDDERYSA